MPSQRGFMKDGSQRYPSQEISIASRRAKGGICHGVCVHFSVGCSRLNNHKSSDFNDVIACRKIKREKNSTSLKRQSSTSKC